MAADPTNQLGAPPGGLPFSHVGCDAYRHSRLAQGTATSLCTSLPCPSIHVSSMGLPQRRQHELEHFRGWPLGEQRGVSQHLAWLWGLQRSHIIVRIPPKEGTRGVKPAHPYIRCMRASIPMRLTVEIFFLSQSQSVKTAVRWLLIQMWTQQGFKEHKKQRKNLNEHNDFPVNNSIETEIHKLPDKELKIIVLRKFSELHKNTYSQLNEIKRQPPTSSMERQKS